MADQNPGGFHCLQCGTCCIAPDISTLNKPAGVRCSMLGPDNRCTDYGNRPPVCRGYKPDEICLLIADPDPEQRVRNYNRIFSL